MEIAAAASPDSFKQENSLKRYGVDRWGEDFLSVNDAGHLVYAAPRCAPVDLHELAERMVARGLGTPFVVRFPTMIEGRLRRLRTAFDAAIAEQHYSGGYCGVFPIKVNQRRAVIDAVSHAPRELGFGLEAGSKPELLIAMSREPTPHAPLLINGFKDREFIRMSFHAAELGHHVIIILESIREVMRYLTVAKAEKWRAIPEVGVRAKLYTRGSGRWQGSGGETSKFGLTTTEILDVVRTLEAEGHLDKLTLLHFHIGSQITRIKRIKEAVREGARLYSELQTRYAPGMHYLDLGGGLGVDYDGSRTSYPSSANYTVEEYASQVVYEINQVMRQTKAGLPTIVTESGRATTAHHAVTITDLREVQGDMLQIPKPQPDEHRLITNLRETLDTINAKNYEEYFHDAIDFRDEVLKLFSAGYLTIEDRASAEGLFVRVKLKTRLIVEGLKRPSEEIVEYLGAAQRKYLANFSIFQSLPDAWSIDQVFPVAPLSRHADRPTLNAEIVDITCDSDGCVTSFAHPDDNMRYLPLHEPTGADERYYIGFFMTGAYQDSLANDHNLMSRPHEVVVQPADGTTASPGTERIELSDGLVADIRPGATNEDTLARMDFDTAGMIEELHERHATVKTTLGESWNLELLKGYAYLNRT
jgi:arginine decarboxylase